MNSQKRCALVTAILIFSSALGGAESQVRGPLVLTFYDGICIQSRVETGLEGADFHDNPEVRKIAIVCDAATLGQFANGRILLSFINRASKTAVPLGFGGDGFQVSEGLQRSDIDHLYLNPPSKSAPDTLRPMDAEGYCFLEKAIALANVRSLSCVAKIEKGGRKTIDKVEFRASKGETKNL